MMGRLRAAAANSRSALLLALAGVTALTRAGMLRPVGPLRLARMGKALYRFGASPATIAAVAAARWPDHPAIIDERGTLSYAELDRRADALASSLAHEFGIGPGAALAVMCRNHAGFVEAMLAAARLGADLLLLNTEFPGGQLGPTLAKYPIGVVVCDEEFVPAFERGGYPRPRVLAWHDNDADITLDGLVSRDVHSLRRPRRPGRVILLTSGTTGAPKGAPRTPSARMFAGAGVSAIGRMRLRTHEPILIAPPLFHGFGMAGLSLALTLGMPAVLQRRFDPPAAVTAIARHRVATLFAVPVMLQRMLRLVDRDRLRRDTATLRGVLSGGAPLSPALAAEFMDAVGDILYNGYGSSEAGIATLAGPADLRAAPGTVGRPVLDTRVEILGEDGAALPAGEVGRIFVGGPAVFAGYSGGGSKELVRGLLDTGDLGCLDADGRLHVAGRSDDMIVSGGENVFPQVVENALANHDAVADVAVLGVADAEFGQRLAAFVVLHNGSEISDEDLIAYLKSTVARYEMPRELQVVDEIPRNPTGKLQRGKLLA